MVLIKGFTSTGSHVVLCLQFSIYLRIIQSLEGLESFVFYFRLTSQLFKMERFNAWIFVVLFVLISDVHVNRGSVMVDEREAKRFLRRINRASSSTNIVEECCREGCHIEENCVKRTSCTASWLQGKGHPQLRFTDVCERDLKATDIDINTWEAFTQDTDHLEADCGVVSSALKRGNSSSQRRNRTAGRSDFKQTDQLQYLSVSSAKETAIHAWDCTVITANLER
ncbi:hypothetical protein OS493_022715 [Desmophyllum pertusum]|uniref:Insulin-like domain-containing protein n=1 Tax=Desmophyllum pertusum TaxID=174260 RepID=A0A9X0CFI6_9CNID|nr:hypothetical protein OS493_022715 [Desmophyllum pertusum]